MAKWTLPEKSQTNDLLGLMEINTLFQEAFAEIKTTLKTQHYTAFCFIYEASKHNEVLMKDVESFLSINQANTHRALHALKDAGLVYISEGETDSRQRCMSIAPKGTEIIRKIGDIFNSGHSATRTSIRRKIKEITERAAHRKKLHEAAQVQELSDRRREVAATLRDREGDGLVEVGSNYIRTNRGSVSLSVLMKRSRAYDIDSLKHYMGSASDDDYEALVTPNPKTLAEREMREAVEALESMKGEN